MKVDSVRLEEMLRESRAIYETFCSVMVSNALAIFWADMAASLATGNLIGSRNTGFIKGYNPRFFCEFLH